MRSSVWVFGFISLAAMSMACGSKPPGVDTFGQGGSSSIGNAGASGDGAGEDGGGAGSGDEWYVPPATVVCRTQDSCEELECGPIADGCGQFIDCGGCTEPATCGGAGGP